MIIEIIVFLMQITLILMFLSAIHRLSRYLYIQLTFHKEIMKEIFSVQKTKYRLILERYKTENAIRRETILRLAKGE